MNPILLQKQLRDNANDLQSIYKDLENWGEEMKRKDEELRNNNKPSSSKTSNSEKKIKTASKPQSPKSIARKIGATDYAKWDKFDAEVECEKLDDDIDDDSEELTDEIDSSNMDAALVEKEKGNKFVKANKWKEAIDCYTKAIDYYSYDPIFYANRALCYLKLDYNEKAESDCTMSLKLDSAYVKAYQRRAAAREALNNLEEAKEDLLRVLKFETHNKESIAALERINAKLGNNKSKEITKEDKEQRPVSKFIASRKKTNTNTMENIGNRVMDATKPEPHLPSSTNDKINVKPIKKPPHLRSKKPLKRIQIIETCNGNPIIEAVKPAVVEKKVEAWPKSNIAATSVNVDDLKIVEKSKPDQPDNILVNDSKKVVKNNSNLTISQKSESQQNLELPKTSVQFYNTWKSLKTSADKYRYLTSITPQDFPKILKESLESNVLSNIFEIMEEQFVTNKYPIFEYLLYFTEIKRFSTFTMFMSTSDKNRLWKLFDYLKEQENVSKEDVDNLIKKYEL